MGFSNAEVYPFGIGTIFLFKFISHGNPIVKENLAHFWRQNYEEGQYRLDVRYRFRFVISPQNFSPEPNFGQIGAKIKKNEWLLREN